MFRRAALLAMSLLGLGALPSAQWHDVPHDPANPVVDEGSLLLHDNGVVVNLYSAATRSWLGLAPTGSLVHGTGDWTALVRPNPDTFRGYSARHHASADLVIAPNSIVATGVEDDVAWVQTVQGGGGGGVLHCYSAQTNAWVSLATAANVPTVVSSRFVVGLIDAGSLVGAGSSPDR